MAPSDGDLRAAADKLEAEIRSGLSHDEEMSARRHLADLYESLRELNRAILHLEECKKGGCKDLPLLRKLVGLYRQTGNHSAANATTQALSTELKLPNRVVATALAFSHLQEERGGAGGVISSLTVNIVAGLLVAALGWIVWLIIQRTGINSNSIAAGVGILGVVLWGLALFTPRGSMWLSALARAVSQPPAGVFLPFFCAVCAAAIYLLQPFPAENPCKKHNIQIQSVAVNLKRLSEMSEDDRKKSPYRKIDISGSGTGEVGESDELWMADSLVGESGFWLYDKINYLDVNKWQGLITADPTTAHYIMVVHIDRAKASAFMRIHDYISAKDAYPGYPTPFPDGFTVCSRYHIASIP